MGIAATQRGGVCLLLLLSGFAHVAFAMETTTIPKQDFQIPSNEFKKIELEKPRSWFFILGMVNAYPKLEREKLIKTYLEPALCTIAPGFDEVKTFTDMRDNGLLWPPQIAAGKLLNEHLALSVHAGFSEGVVHTQSRDASLLLGLPLHTDIRIYRKALYIGLDLDYYPLGAVALKHYESFLERLRAAKPALGTRLTWTHAGFSARVQLGMGPIKDLVSIRLKEDWLLPSLNVNAGVDIPWSKNSVLVFNGGYNFFSDQRQDFNGAAFTIGWRYFFK